MAGQSDYMTGWINTTIHGFLEEVDQTTSGLKYVLVTCLDSSPEVASIFGKSKHLTSLRGKYRAVGGGVLLRTHHLLAARRQGRIFFGFDEVWFFPTPDIASKPEGLAITSPDSIEAGQIERYSGWLSSHQCSLGLGDGVGMNYCVRLRGAAKYLVRAINEDRPRSLDGGRETA